MSTSTILIEAVVLATILAAILIGFIQLVLRRARDRRRQLEGDLATDRRRAEDRAYNAVRLATAEAKVLERDGVDVSAPRRLLEQADAALARGDHYHALTTGQAAHEALVRLRRESRAPPLPTGAGAFGGHPAGPAAVPGPRPTVDLSLAEPVPVDDGGPAPEKAAVPKNRIEALFQIRLLGEEIAAAEPRPDAADAVAEARQLLDQAEASQAKGDHTDALRLALKGRRRIGGRVESLPPSGASAGRAASVPAPDRASGPRAAASAPPTGPVCPHCGQPSRPADLFCRSCGQPVGTARCPRCQASLEADDRFCPRCGAPSG